MFREDLTNNMDVLNEIVLSRLVAHTSDLLIGRYHYQWGKNSRTQSKSRCQKA
jgi:hypothetical protein